MNRRPLLAGTAACAALALCATASSADAATAASPASGKASSILSLVHIVAGGHDLRAGDIALVSSTLAGTLSTVTVTPVTADGTAYGTKSITSSDAPVTVGSQGTPGALSSVASLTSPAIKIAASAVPAAAATTTSLGSLSLLGLPVPLTGEIGAGSSVRSTGALGTKSVTLKNLALPSIADILGALGLDLSKLPAGTLTDLLSQLHLLTSGVSTAQGAVDTAQANVDDAVAALVPLTASLTSAQGALTTAQATLATATTALNAAIGSNSVALGLLGITNIASLLSAVDPELASALLLPGMSTAFTSYNAAASVVGTATTAVATAQGLVNTAQALVDSLNATLLGLVNTLLTNVVGVLDTTPLVSLGTLEVSTKALAKSASAGGQTAEIVGGTVTGLKVLGTDVLATALGSTTIDLEGVTSSALATVNSAIGTLTGTLSSVLSSVPGFPTLDIPAPVVGLLTKSATTSISGGYGRANTVVTGLSIKLPAVAIPSALALPGAVNLPALDGVTQVAGLLQSAPVSIGLVNLTDQAAFRPAVVASGTSGTPGTGGPGFGDTGLPVGVSLLAMATVGCAFLLRRRVLSST